MGARRPGRSTHMAPTFTILLQNVLLPTKFNSEIQFCCSGPLAYSNQEFLGQWYWARLEVPTLKSINVFRPADPGPELPEKERQKLRGEKAHDLKETVLPATGRASTS